MTATKTLETDANAIGQRVDAYLAKALPEISRARIQNLLAQGQIIGLNGKLKPSHRIGPGEILTVNIPEATPNVLVAQELELDVIYEDQEIVVLNKPAGLVVHPGAGHLDGTLVNALLHRFPDMQLGDVQRPGLVHRLDKDTSGVMVCARNDAAFLALANQFKSREILKIYRAFCYGKFKKTNFELITGHARHKSDRKRFTTKLLPPTRVGSGVRLAHSRFEDLLSAGGVTELRVELLTGRTHQIRAHLSDIHHPLLHDTLYSALSRIKQLAQSPVRDAVLALTRHGLHAESIEFEHPSSNKKMRFEAKLPAELQAIHDAMLVVLANE